MIKILVKSIFLSFILVHVAIAEITVEQLIEQTGIKASSTAMRELPGWSGAKKIVVRAGTLDLDVARRAHSDVE